MIVLLGFAVLAGAGTALSPCVLPVLPALLSAGGVGGRRRPLGIVLGLSITFTVTIVGVANVVDGVGLGSDPLRDVAIAVLLVFGLTLLLPAWPLAWRRPCRGSRASARARAATASPPGLLVGGALGFVYTPCASPILAAVISVSAASGRTIVIALAYAAGSALVLLALSLGGRRLFDRVAQGRSRAAAAARARHDHDPHGGRDPDQPRRQLRPVRRPAHPRRQPHRVARVLAHGDQPPARDHRSPDAKFEPANGSSACGGSSTKLHRGGGATPARRACSPTRKPCPTTARHPNSRKPRTGSTRPASTVR